MLIRGQRPSCLPSNVYLSQNALHCLETHLTQRGQCVSALGRKGCLRLLQLDIGINLLPFSIASVLPSISLVGPRFLFALTFYTFTLFAHFCCCMGRSGVVRGGVGGVISFARTTVAHACFAKMEICGLALARARVAAWWICVFECGRNAVQWQKLAETEDFLRHHILPERKEGKSVNPAALLSPNVYPYVRVVP